jgi:outer membrane protein
MEKSAEAEADIVSIEVIKSFYNVSFCKAMVAQIEEQLARDRKTMMATERGEQLGTKSGADVAEIRAILANDEYELTNQRNLLAKAYLQLRGAMGMEISTEPLDLVETEYEAEPVAGFIHPRLEEALMAVKESRYNLRAAKGAFSPRISLSAGASTSYYKMIGDHFPAPGFSRQLRDNMGQYIGLSVSIPLFTGLATANKVKRAGIELATCRTQLEQTRYDIERQKTEARLDYRASAEEFVSAQARLDAEQLAYNAIRRKFELGSASAIDLYTSGAKLASARAALEGKRINRIICRITLGYYLGEKLIHEK